MSSALPLTISRGHTRDEMSRKLVARKEGPGVVKPQARICESETRGAELLDCNPPHFWEATGVLATASQVLQDRRRS